MRIFGFEVTRRKSATDTITYQPQGFVTQWPTWASIRESFAGAWQRRVPASRTGVLSYSTVWSCVTLIARDISKMRVRLVERDANGICREIQNPAYSPVLKWPNHFQTWVKFNDQWNLSRLTTGNAYILKERNHRGGTHNGNVVAMYVLDPSRVQVLVAPDGSVFYELGADTLAGLQEAVRVPASEIIHDVEVPLFHPLCGVSSMYASAANAMQGLQTQQNSAKLFENGSQLSGVLTAPAAISNATAERLQAHWEQNFTGQQNAGKVAVLGDGLKFEPMTMTAVDAQLVDQLKWGDQQICGTYHVPGYMVGIGAAPPYTDIQSINLQYYSQALLHPIQNMEALLARGLELPSNLWIDFDVESLARMDTKTQMETATSGVSGGIFTPNEARAKFDLAPVEGGDSVYMQQQMYSLEALAMRDAAGLVPPTPPIAPAPVEPAPPTRQIGHLREVAAMRCRTKLLEAA